MSQIMKISMARLLLVIGFVFLGGCGSSTPNSQAIVSAEGEHAAEWMPAGHMIAARADKVVCTECHGSDYLGGIAQVSCSSCHLGGTDSIHPIDWGKNTTTLHGAYVDSNGSMACANAVCHGSTLAGVQDSGPACNSCHLNETYPFTSIDCTSCHGEPPTGTVAPNRSGAHAAHNALPVVSNVCDTCHSGAGTMTQNHYNGVVDVLFLTIYNAKSGSAVRNPDGTCSKVSCHGGKTTPAWLAGTIDVNTQCASCHDYGTAPAMPEYNSFHSGQHDVHVNDNSISCTMCHDTTTLAMNHFTSLNTTTMEGPASATILNSFGYSGGSCTPGCHETRTW